VDGNAYVRAASRPEGGDAKPVPLVTWSPAPTDSCLTPAASLDEFRALAPAFEAHGQLLDLSPRSVFKSPELGRYELQGPLPGTTRAATPSDVLKVLGWSAQDARTAGAYPLRQ
jgi:hypothetical protein